MTVTHMHGYSEHIPFHHKFIDYSEVWVGDFIFVVTPWLSGEHTRYKLYKIDTFSSCGNFFRYKADSGASLSLAVINHPGYVLYVRHEGEFKEDFIEL